jgi:uncharacterized protein (DUF1330 family)
LNEDYIHPEDSLSDMLLVSLQSACRNIDVLLLSINVAAIINPEAYPMSETKSVYALNLFDVANTEEYLLYSRRSAREVAAHGGRVLALGKFRESIIGDIEPRTVLILVEWESREAFQSYRDDPELADLHPHREEGTANYIWHLFDRLDDLRPLLKNIS